MHPFGCLASNVHKMKEEDIERVEKQLEVVDAWIPGALVEAVKKYKGFKDSMKLRENRLANHHINKTKRAAASSVPGVAHAPVVE